MNLYWFCQQDMTSPAAPRTQWKVGDTRSLTGQITIGHHGFHGSPDPYDALQYITGPMLCRVDITDDLMPLYGEPVDRYVGRTKTLLAAVDITRILQDFALECAERVLPIFEKQYPPDARPRAAIDTARAYLKGDTTRKDVREASYAAQDSYQAYYYAAEAAYYAATAADNVAWAKDAANFALEAAAYVHIDTERAWQRERFNSLGYAALEESQ